MPVGPRSNLFDGDPDWKLTKESYGRIFIKRKIRQDRTIFSKIKFRSISTVEGSGAICTRIFFNFFLQNRWSFYGPFDPKNSKKGKKRQKCMSRPKRDSIYSFMRHSGSFWCITTALFQNLKSNPKFAKNKFMDRNHVAAYTGHQVQFWSGFAIFDILEGTTDVSKIAKPCQNCTWWPV